MNEEQGIYSTDDDLFIELSSRELRALDAVSVISSLFSITGSTLLVTKLWQERRVEWTSHHRFLFGLSAFDIVVSFLRYTLIPWTGSSEPSPSCTFQGTMIMFTTVAPLYNMSLSLYYVSIIRYQIRPKAFATRYEPFLHVCSIGLPFVVGMVLLATQGYNPSGSLPSCSLSAYPPGCDLPASTVPCERGVLAAAILFYAYTPMFLLVLALLFGSNFLIFLYVRELEARNLHWRSFSTRNNTRNNIINNDNAEADVSTEERRANFRQTRLVATQSFLYVAAFLLANIWPIVGAVLSITDGLGVRRGEYFGWLLAMHMCHPAQGFFNAMVYVRGVLHQRNLDSSPAGNLSRSARAIQRTEGNRRESLAAAAICCDCWGTVGCTSTCCSRQPSVTVPARESEKGNGNDTNVINEARPQGSVVEEPSPVNVASEPGADSSVHESSSSSLPQEPPTPISTIRSTTTTSQPSTTTSPLAEESNGAVADLLGKTLASSAT